jgi:Flp pilus assembly protein TadG
MRRDRSKERGNQTLEFTLIGLPLVFMLFSIANMCFAMLTLHTMQEAVEQGARYVVTRGSTCSSGTNTCTATVQQIAGTIANSAAGISPSNLNVSLIPATAGNTVTCNPLSSCLASCPSGCNASRTNVFPGSASSDNSPGKEIVVSADCSVASPIFMYWPGSGTGEKMNSTSFHAYSRQRVMF